MKRWLRRILVGLLGLVVVASGSELIYRAYLNSLRHDRAPDNWVVADPTLGFRLAPGSPVAQHRPPEHSFAGPKSRFRILLLGDGGTWEDRAFPALMAQGLGKGYELVNSAVPGYTIYQERLTLERDLSTVRPNLVLLQYTANDHYRFSHVLVDGRWELSNEAQVGLVCDDSTWLGALTYQSRLLLALRLLVSRPVNPAGAASEPANPAWRPSGWAVYEQEFENICRLCASHNVRLAVVGIPLLTQLEAPPSVDFYPQQRLNDLCARNGVPFLDLGIVFQAAEMDSPFSLYLPNDAIHLSDYGHYVAAHALREFLNRNGLLSPPLPTGTNAWHPPHARPRPVPKGPALALSPETQ